MSDLIIKLNTLGSSPTTGRKRKWVPLDEVMRVRVADYRRTAGAIILANPNAPTGMALSRSEVAATGREEYVRRAHGRFPIPAEFRAYVEAVEQAKRHSDYLLERAIQLFPPRDADGKSKALNYLLPHIRRKRTH